MAATKSVRIPPEEYDILKRYAEKVERTLAQVLARAINNYCRERKEA